MKKMLWAILLAAVAGFWLGTTRTPAPAHVHETETDEETIYTCSMHPQIRQPNPGLCPLCGMDLIPLRSESGSELGPREIRLSDAARARARIETALAERHTVSQEVRLAGKLAWPTTGQHELTLWSDGQVRRLHHAVVGAVVKAGEPLAEIYSPEVFAASRELQSAKRSNQTSLIEAARTKLRLLGVSEDQAEGASDTYTLYSPIDGLITSINAWEGGQVPRGGRLMVITDPTLLWAQLDANESDLAHVSVGQPAVLQVESSPGHTWEGEVTFIAPYVDDPLRRIQVRVDLANEDGHLKEGAFVRAVIQGQPIEDALVVPTSAVLYTGKRAIMYVESPDDHAVFEGRLIVTGPRVGDQYVVTEGLMEGERVAVRGAMRIDSSMQLMAKPSMMNPVAERDPSAELQPQTVCPILLGPINGKTFVEYQGMRIGFCCPGCDETFLEDPEKYLAEMRERGEKPLQLTPENSIPEEVPHVHDH